MRCFTITTRSHLTLSRLATRYSRDARVDQFVHFVRGIKTNHKLKVKVKVVNLADLLNEVDKE